MNINQERFTTYKSLSPVLTTQTTSESGATDGTGAGALFNYPCGITTDGTNIYVADTENNTIRSLQ